MSQLFGWPSRRLAPPEAGQNDAAASEAEPNRTSPRDGLRRSFASRLARGAGVILLFLALTVLMTWPQAAHMATYVGNSDDPLLSIWRMAWIAHALPRFPLELFNGNIFYPEPRTLAYSDAVLLQGIAGAPLIWSGVSVVTAYNWVLLGSIALSGAAMWLYAFQLTGSRLAALLAGIIFAFVPFRFDHLHHLELQATMFIPLTLWWVERALASGRPIDVYGAVGSLVCQVLCGIYYAVFLGTALLLIIPLRLYYLPPERRRALLKPAVGALVVGAIVVVPYLLVYSANRSTLGDRSLYDVGLYSAELDDYLATPVDNLVHGVWSGPLGKNERRLFPGLLALLLALIGLFRFDRTRLTLVVLATTGFVISLGLNTPLYWWLRAIGFPYSGLRVPSRAAILVCAAVAALAALGWSWIESRFKWRATAATIVAGLLLFEYATRLDVWLVLPTQPPAVYKWLAEQPRSVVLHFPLSTADKLDIIHDSLYMLGSTVHWQPILNGYSGYFPKSFFELMEHCETFPDERSIAYLKSRRVDLIVVHGGYMSPDRFGKMTAGLIERGDIETVAKFEEKFGPDVVFRLRR
jgi:hypothetical protein